MPKNTINLDENSINSSKLDSSEMKQAINKDKNKKILYISIGVVLIILLAGGGYYFYNKNQTTQTNNTQTANANGFQRRAGAGNFSFVTGQLISLTNKTAIVDSSDNSGQKIIQLSDNTNVIKQDISNKNTALKTDQTVIIKGNKNGDSFNADNITLTLTPANPPSNNNGGNNRPNRNGGSGQNNGGNNIGRNNPASPLADANTLRGKITVVSDTQITIQTGGNNGKSTKVNLQSSTTYSQQSKGSISDLKEGQKLQIVGLLSGTTITANTITVE